MANIFSIVFAVFCGNERECDVEFWSSWPAVRTHGLMWHVRTGFWRQVAAPGGGFVACGSPVLCAVAGGGDMTRQLAGGGGGSEGGRGRARGKIFGFDDLFV